MSFDPMVLTKLFLFTIGLMWVSFWTVLGNAMMFAETNFLKKDSINSPRWMYFCVGVCGIFSMELLFGGMYEWFWGFFIKMDIVIWLGDVICEFQVLWWRLGWHTWICRGWITLRHEKFGLLWLIGLLRWYCIIRK